ncbi:hypothetical protein [uncultured Marinobacter sp.]|uniref:hypothetical protein n=1 Tax=uncultured Marinobacter sp. TaxID=187379 RepID=UPI0030DA8739
MTADELIARLSALPPDTPVLVEGYENGFDEIIALKGQDVVRYRLAQPWDGQYQPPERFEKPTAGIVQAAVILGRRGPLR